VIEIKLNADLSEGSRQCSQAANGRGFNSPQVHVTVTVAQPVERLIGSRVHAGTSPRPSPRIYARRQLVADNGPYPRADAKGQGCHTAVILAHTPEESKGQNDVPQPPLDVRISLQRRHSPSSVEHLPWVLQVLCKLCKQCSVCSERS
jgi:hypothetical protein